MTLLASKFTDFASVSSELYPAAKTATDLNLLFGAKTIKIRFDANPKVPKATRPSRKIPLFCATAIGSAPNFKTHKKAVRSRLAEHGRVRVQVPAPKTKVREGATKYV